jgi:hypothetical protein
VGAFAANWRRIRGQFETGEDSGEDSTLDPHKTPINKGF